MKRKTFAAHQPFMLNASHCDADTKHCMQVYHKNGCARHMGKSNRTRAQRQRDVIERDCSVHTAICFGCFACAVSPIGHVARSATAFFAVCLRTFLCTAPRASPAIAIQFRIAFPAILFSKLCPRAAHISLAMNRNRRMYRFLFVPERSLLAMN